MLKGKEPYIIFIVGILFISYAEFTKPKKLDWSPTFSKDDKIPYGAYVLFNLLEDLFPGGTLFVNKNSIYNDFDLDDINDAVPLADSTNLIIISGRSDDFNFTQGGSTSAMDKYETEALLNYAAAGNNVFIATDNFSNLLSDTLQFDLKYEGAFSLKDTVQYNYCFYNNVEINIPSRHIKYVLDSIKNESTTVLANCNHWPVLAQFPFGKGNFYVSTMPKLFSNYFLLKDDSLNLNNYKIAEQSFKLLPSQITYWDEHYKYKIEDPFAKKSPLHYVLSERALKWALYTTIFALLIFMLFKSKRLQSIIPVVEPEKNLDVDFATTIGTLYFNEGNHADLAKKKITYWKEYIRMRYNLNTKKLDDVFKEQLKKKSKLNETEINELVNTANKLSHASSIDKTHLINFNKLLEKFYGNY